MIEPGSDSLNGVKYFSAALLQLRRQLPYLGDRHGLKLTLCTAREKLISHSYNNTSPMWTPLISGNLSGPHMVDKPLGNARESFAAFTAMMTE